MLAWIQLALHLQGRFSRANSTETKGYGWLALESYPPSQEDQRRVRAGYLPEFWREQLAGSQERQPVRGFRDTFLQGS